MLAAENLSVFPDTCGAPPHRSFNFGNLVERFAFTEGWCSHLSLLNLLIWSTLLERQYQSSNMPPSHNSILVVTAIANVAAAVNNGLAITPPMGWVRCFCPLPDSLADPKRTTGTLLDAMFPKTCFSQPRPRSLTWVCETWVITMSS